MKHLKMFILVFIYSLLWSLYSTYISIDPVISGILSYFILSNLYDVFSKDINTQK